jgi:hypothetical protein
MSGFKINDLDIDTIFMPATASGAQKSSTNTGYTTNNTDLSQRFCKYLRGAKRTETGRYTNDGEDFVNFFQNINVPVTDWSALGTGLLTQSYNQKIVFNEFTNELYSSYGPFNSEPSVEYEYKLVVWNGINWTIKGTFNKENACIEIDDSNNLYVVGSFTNVDGVPVNYIAKYNISTSSLSSHTSKFGNICFATSGSSLKTRSLTLLGIIFKASE